MSSAHLAKFAKVKTANIEWRDGMPFNLDFDDIYFSPHNGLAESQHVYVDGCQLLTDWSNKPQKHFYLAELGFGSGLNFLLTYQHWKKQSADNNSQLQKQQKKLHYIAIEKHPFCLKDLTKACKLWPELNEFSNKLLINYPSTTYGRHQLDFSKDNLTLSLFFMPVETALDELINENKNQQKLLAIDHWFLDGFAPKKNPQMWSQTIISKIQSLSKIGSKIATFSVASHIKTPPKNCGFSIKKIKGYARKREMLTAVLEKTIPAEKTTPTAKQTSSTYINIKYETPWYFSKSLKPAGKIAIIGAGIAGCATAYYLAQANLDCDIFDTEKDVAQKASGVSAGLVHPQLTADMNISSQLSWLAYLYLLRFIQQLTPSEAEKLIISQGVERVFNCPQQKQAIDAITQIFNLQQWIKPAGINAKNSSAVFYPQAIALDSYQLCRLLLNKSLINKNISTNRKIFFQQKIQQISRQDNYWQIRTSKNIYDYSQIVFCTGANYQLLKPFIQLPLHIPIHVTRGQTCHIQAENINLNAIQTNYIVEKIYAVKQKLGDLVIGASFDESINTQLDYQLNQKTQDQLLTQGKALFKKSGLVNLFNREVSEIPLHGKVGYRLHTRDRMPLVGAMPDEKKLVKDFSGLGQKRLKSNLITNYNLSGLWLNTAYGSHGLLYALLLSRHLASFIAGEISPLNQQISHAINPARFMLPLLKKSIPN